MRLALTLGDPRGIGPEIVGKALSDPRIAALSASAHGPNAVAWRVIGPRGCGLPVHDDLGAWRPRAMRRAMKPPAGALPGVRWSSRRNSRCAARSRVW